MAPTREGRVYLQERKLRVGGLACARKKGGGAGGSAYPGLFRDAERAAVRKLDVGNGGAASTKSRQLSAQGVERSREGSGARRLPTTGQRRDGQVKRSRGNGWRGNTRARRVCAGPTAYSA